MARLYVMQMEGTQNFKVGVSSDVRARLSQLATGSPEELVAILEFEAPDPFKAEREWLEHMELYGLKKHGEWFEWKGLRLNLAAEIERVCGVSCVERRFGFFGRAA